MIDSEGENGDYEEKMRGNRMKIGGNEISKSEDNQGKIRLQIRLQLGKM
nr:hypothetical protein [Mycobacterium sp. E3298]